MTDPEQRLELHDRYYALLLDKVREDRYPSTKMLDMLDLAAEGCRQLFVHQRQKLAGS